MNIGIVLANNYPLDREVRIRRFAKTFNENGHSTTIFARNTQTDPARGAVRRGPSPRRDRLEYATVERFSWFVTVPVLSLLLLPIPFNPVWILWLLLRFQRENIDVVVTSNLRAGPTAIVAAKLLGIPVIADVPENHAELAKVTATGSPVAMVFRNHRIVRLVESFVFVVADMVWVVTPERAAILSPRVQKRANITVVMNVPSLSDASDSGYTDIEPPGMSDDSTFSFVYVGVINDFRGLDVIIEALEYVDRDEDVEVIIAGEGPHRECLETLAVQCGVDDRVRFIGWLDANIVPAFLRAGDVGLIPHEVGPLTNTTLPNKLFDCMLQGLPVLVTEMEPVARIVNERECGLIIPNEAGVAEVGDIMVRMMHSPTLKEMGDRGRDAVESRYNWEVESERVVNSVSSVTRQRV